MLYMVSILNEFSVKRYKEINYDGAYIMKASLINCRSLIKWSMELLETYTDSDQSRESSSNSKFKKKNARFKSIRFITTCSSDTMYEISYDNSAS